MGNFYIHNNVRHLIKHEVPETSLEYYYPYVIDEFCVKPFFEFRGIQTIEYRRWVERECKGDVYFNDFVHKSENGTIIDMAWKVYFEFEVDAMLFKLTWF